MQLELGMMSEKNKMNVSVVVLSAVSQHSHLTAHELNSLHLKYKNDMCTGGQGTILLE